MNGDDYQGRLDVLIDGTIDLLEQATRAGVELNPLETIIARLQARGTELDTESMPPLLRMLLSGMNV